MRYLKENSKYIILFALSLLAYFLFFELNRLSPSNINWLFQVRGDWAQHYLGWEFFRKEPWQFPIGELSNYNYPTGSNIVYTDSIPLLAIIFKLFNFLLPNTFQYIGLWVFVCVFFNGLFSYKLLRFYKVNNPYTYIFTFLILVNPVLIFRTMHPALCAHWFIIGAIYYYVSANTEQVFKKNYQNTLFFFVLSGLISPYLTLFMVGFVVLMITRNIVVKQYVSVFKTIVQFVVASIILLTVWYAIGALGGGEKLGVEGNYNIYGMNLNSLFNSRGRATIFKGLPVFREHQFEGYMYLGAGLILLLGISTILFFIGRNNKLFSRKNILLLVLTSLFALFSISHEVTYNDKLLFNIPLMDRIAPIANIFRASGRYFWVAYYLLIFLVSVVFYRAKINKFIKYVLIFCVVSLQMYDSQIIFRDLNYKVGDYVSDLHNKNWEELFKTYPMVVTMPMYTTSMFKKLDYQEFCYYANKYNNKITTGYSARSRKEAQQKFTNTIIKDIAKVNINDSTLFISTEKMLPYFYNLYKKQKVNVRAIDNYFAIYPKKNNLQDKLTYRLDDKTKTEKAQKRLLNKEEFTEINQKIISKEKITFNIENYLFDSNFIQINGWAFLTDGKNNVKDSIFVVLKGEEKTYKIPVLLEERPDITNTFKKENLNNSGFRLFTFIDNIDKSNYKVFITIKNGITQKESSIYTQKKLINSFSEVKQIEENISKNNNVTGNIDVFKKENETIKLNGWGIFKGVSSNQTKKSIILIHKNTQYKVNTSTEVRKDVTNYFSKKEGEIVNYNQSGLSAQFNIENLPKGKYKVAILIENRTTKQKGIFITDKLFLKN